MHGLHNATMYTSIAPSSSNRAFGDLRALGLRPTPAARPRSQVGRIKTGRLPEFHKHGRFTVNDQGAFFRATWGNKTFTVGRRAYGGITLKAQSAIILHEPGHQMNESGGADGFQGDFGNKKAGRANDKLVDTNCGTLIKDLK